MNGKYDIALLTFEMFLGIAVGTPSVLNQIGLVVVDEGQFITDPNRGITVELLLTYLIAGRELGINPQLIVLSAVIGNINHFDEWLGCRQLVTTERPVPLIEGVLDRTGTFQFVDVDGQHKTEQLLPYGSVRQRKSTASFQDVIVPLVRKLLDESPAEQVIIFRNKRGSAEGCANYLAEDLGLPPATGAVEALQTADLSSSSIRLKNCLNGGTAFHNTNLHVLEKEVVERAFRDPEGGVRVLGATTTVAAGINTPASTVILAEQEFVGDDGRPFTIAEYKNMAGRAGRLGLSEQGKSILLAENPFQRDVLFRKYVLGDLDSLSSSFDLNHLETWILRLLAQVGKIPRADVSRLLANTYGGYLAILTHPEWRQGVEDRINRLLQIFIDNGLVEEEAGMVQLTLLGKVCGRSSLQYASMIRLLGLLRRVQPDTLNPRSLTVLLQALPELDSVATPIAKGGRRENRVVVKTETGWPASAAMVFGREMIAFMQGQVDEISDYYARCKRALIIADWVNGVSVDTIERTYTCNFYSPVNYGTIRGIVDITRFHLRAAHEIATVLFIEREPDETALESFLRQLEEGLPADALGLLALPVQLARGENMILHRAGIKESSELWKLTEDEIVDLLGRRRTDELEPHRPK